MPIQLAKNNNEHIAGAELELVWEDGVHKTALWNVRPFHDKDSNVAGVIAYFEEITQQKQIEELLKAKSKELSDSVRRYRAMFENCPDAMV